MATAKSQRVTDRILVHNIHTEISDNDLREELLTTYQGVKHAKRLYYDKECTRPKERVLIVFISPKYTETLLQDGFMIIEHLRCPVQALKPSMHLQNQLQNDNGSDCQSDIFIQEQQVTDKILIHDVPTKLSQSDLQEELSKTHPGIKYVKRWYHVDQSKGPTGRVQIGFISPKDTEGILQDGFIRIDRCYCSVTALRPSQRWQNQLDSDYGSDYQSEISTETEVIADQILVCNVPVKINENALLRNLAKTYPGIKQIKRWFFDDDCLHPMVCVQIDLTSSEDAELILRTGSITYGGSVYQVTPLKSSRRLQNAFASQSESNFQSSIYGNTQRVIRPGAYLGFSWQME